VKGYQRGRTIGTPTINLDCGDQFIPADGVYAGRVSVDGVEHAAAVSIGNAPTFEDAIWQVEAHILDFDGDLYDRTIHLQMIDWLREQRKFRGLDELKGQIARDIEDCRERESIDASRMIGAAL
jgi:riboflavin kinase/FMN adenylyltransferase